MTPDSWRTHVTMGRAIEYFETSELGRQTGRPIWEFTDVIVKETVDNGFDGAESAGRAPCIDLRIDAANGRRQITISDNGDGIDGPLLDRLFDPNTRTSDKLGVRTPTRGLQGQASKTLLGIPYALGSREPLIVRSQGIEHRITARVDGAGIVHVTRDEAPWSGEGTSITVTLPTDGQDCTLDDWARRFALVNPHALVKISQSFDPNDVDQSDPIEIEDFYQPLVNFPDPWTKWLPGDRPSAHWYDLASLRAFIALQIAATPTDNPAPLIRDFVGKFAGLQGSAKAKRVTDSLSGAKRLDEIADDDDAITRLLRHMQEHSRPIPATRLGAIGEAAIKTRFDDWYGLKPDRFWYRQERGEVDGIPFIVEAAVGQTRLPGERTYALNFSPVYGDPFADTRIVSGKVTSYGLNGWLNAAHVGENAAVLVHITSPVLRTTDRAKTGLVPSRELQTAVGAALWRVAKTCYTDGERAQRGLRARERETVRWVSAIENSVKKLSLRDASFRVMEEARLNATGNDQYEVGQRMVYYQVRALIQRYELTDQVLEDTYFLGTIIKEYQLEHGPLPNVFRQPRGELREPHHGQVILPGTREVRAYRPTLHLFDRVLLIEKEGLMPMFLESGISEKFDMAILSCAGYTTEAARELVARFDQEHRIKLYIFHDADPAGYEIVRTVREETWTMPGHHAEVIDLGVTWDQAMEMGRSPETFVRKQALPEDLVKALTDAKLTETLAAFTGVPDPNSPPDKDWHLAQRLEINELTAPEQIAFVERRLHELHADTKLIPKVPVLTEYTREKAENVLRERARDILDELTDRDVLLDRLRDSDLGQGIIDDSVTGASRNAVKKRLRRERQLRWTVPVSDQIDTTLDDADDDLRQWLRDELGLAETGD